jgi:hypothetical protein
MSRAVLGILASGTMRAQVAQPRAFEVASVRLTQANTPPSRRVTDTRVDIVNMSLRALLVRVFQVDQPSPLREMRWRPARVRGRAAEVPLHLTFEYVRDNR